MKKISSNKKSNMKIKDFNIRNNLNKEKTKLLYYFSSSNILFMR